MEMKLVISGVTIGLVPLCTTQSGSPQRRTGKLLHSLVEVMQEQSNITLLGIVASQWNKRQDEIRVKNAACEIPCKRGHCYKNFVY